LVLQDQVFRQCSYLLVIAEKKPCEQPPNANRRKKDDDSAASLAGAREISRERPRGRRSLPGAVAARPVLRGTPQCRPFWRLRQTQDRRGPSGSERSAMTIGRRCRAISRRRAECRNPQTRKDPPMPALPVNISRARGSSESAARGCQDFLGDPNIRRSLIDLLRARVFRPRASRKDAFGK